jgi:hypothetical protein
VRTHGPSISAGVRPFAQVRPKARMSLVFLRSRKPTRASAKRLQTRKVGDTGFEPVTSCVSSDFRRSRRKLESSDFLDTLSRMTRFCKSRRHGHFLVGFAVFERPRGHGVDTCPGLRHARGPRRAAVGRTGSMRPSRERLDLAWRGRASSCTRGAVGKYLRPSRLRPSSSDSRSECGTFLVAPRIPERRL